MRIASFRVCVCWLAVCHVPHLLSDGLFITRASDIHVCRGTCTVLVVIVVLVVSPERASHGGASERIKTGYRETGNPSELFAYDLKCLGAAHPRHGGYDDTSLAAASQHTN